MASGVGEEEDMGFPVAERFCLCFLVSVWLFPGAVSNGSRAMIENPALGGCSACSGRYSPDHSHGQSRCQG